MSECCFAVVPDERDEPTAVFRELEDAMAWGLEQYGGDRFRIRRFLPHGADPRPS